MDGPHTYAWDVVRAVGRPAGYRHGSALGSQATRNFPGHGRGYTDAPEGTRRSQPIPARFNGSYGRTDASVGCAAGDGTIVRIALAASSSQRLAGHSRGCQVTSQTLIDRRFE